MKKAIWIAFGVAIIIVTGTAESVEYFTDTNINLLIRVLLIMGLLLVAMVFLGAIALIGIIETEKPLAGTVNNTLGADKSDKPKP